MRHPLKTALAVALMVAASANGATSVDSPDPDKTYGALAILLASYGKTVPAGSSCDGAFSPTQKGPAKIGDVFAYRLAYLSDGTNVVSGACEANAGRQECEVAMTHANGEDVASTTIRFHAVKGQLVPASLACVITP